MAYMIDTIGELPGAPPATPGTSAPAPSVAPLSALALVGVAVGGLVIGALGLYAWERIRK